MKTVPLTLACALLFWGYASELTILSILCAALVELPRIIKKRWNPTNTQINKLSDTCSVVIAGSIIYFISTTPEYALQRTLIFLPVFSFPLVFIQEFTVSGRTDIKALYLFKKKHIADPVKVEINLGFPYIILCLVSAGAVNNRSIFYYFAAGTIIGVVLFFLRSKRSSIPVWGLSILTAALMGILLSSVLVLFQEKMTGIALDFLFDDSADPFRQSTALGAVGRLKLSNKIVFRVIAPGKKKQTYLLKEASYTYFSKNSWVAANTSFKKVEKTDLGKFPLLPGKVNGELTILSRLKNGQGLLRVPEKVLMLNGTGVSVIKTNGLGAYYAEDCPGFITYNAGYGKPDPGLSPPGKMDLYLPDGEKKLFSDLAKELDLPNRPARQALNAVNSYFLTRFTYSLDLIQENLASPITGFITRSKTGHCEYFATATVLLLRGAGIPARYVSGYLAFEKSPLEGKIVVRRKHAHAWAEVYIDGKWIFFDTTPPSWMDDEETGFLKKLLPDLFSFIGFGLASLRWGDPGMKKQLLWLLVPLFILIIRRLLKEENKNTKKAASIDLTLQDTVPGADNSLYYLYKLEEKLEKSGYERKKYETYGYFFERIKDSVFIKGSEKSITEVIKLHNRLRFGNYPLTGDEIDLLKENTDRLTDQLTKTFATGYGSKEL